MFFYPNPSQRQFISISYMAMGGLDTIFTLLTTFVILKKSAKDMRTYKSVQLNIMFSSFLFDMATVVGQAVVILPHPGLMLLSPLGFSSFGMMVLSTFWIAGFSCCVNAIIFSCYYRLYTLSFGYSREMLKKGAPWMGLLYLNLVPNQLFTWLAYFDGAPEHTRKMIDTTPELFVLKNEKSVMIFDLSEIWFRCYLIYVSFTMTTIIAAMAFMKYTILKWLTHQKRNLSPVALAFHNRMIVTLFLQAFTTFTCTCLPFTAALFSAFGVSGIPDFVTSLCALYGSFHSTPNCLLILLTTTPYREYFIDLLHCRWNGKHRLESHNQTTILFTRWNNKRRQSQHLQVIF